MHEQFFVNLPVKNREASEACFMHGHGFEDVDGHVWERVHMEPNASGLG
jgi:predicted lactoylglutathione lyase